MILIIQHRICCREICLIRKQPHYPYGPGVIRLALSHAAPPLVPPPFLPLPFPASKSGDEYVIELVFESERVRNDFRQLACQLTISGEPYTLLKKEKKVAVRHSSPVPPNRANQAIMDEMKSGEKRKPMGYTQSFMPASSLHPTINPRVASSLGNSDNSDDSDDDDDDESDDDDGGAVNKSDVANPSRRKSTAVDHRQGLGDRGRSMDVEGSSTVANSQRRRNSYGSQQRERRGSLKTSTGKLKASTTMARIL